MQRAEIVSQILAILEDVAEISPEDVREDSVLMDPLHDAGADAVLQSKNKEKDRFRKLRNRSFCALEGAARRTAEAVAVHRRAAGGRAFLVGRVVDLHTVGVGVVVHLHPQL